MHAAVNVESRSQRKANSQCLLPTQTAMMIFSPDSSAQLLATLRTGVGALGSHLDLVAIK